MTINYTTNLALGQPVTGTESGTWGDDVNNSITSYLDIAIGGTNNITTDADVTLTLTQGTSSATNISGTSAQYYILNLTGSRTAARAITAPSSSRAYLITNATTGGYAVTIKKSAGTGVSIANGETAIVYYNTVTGDYVKASSSVITNLTGTLATTNGGTGLTTFTAANNAIYSTSSSALTAGTLPIAAGGTGQATASAAFNALSPVTTTGDLIIGNGTNSATRLAIGANTYVLTSNGTTASWAAAASGISTGKSIAMAMIFGF